MRALIYICLLFLFSSCKYVYTNKAVQELSLAPFINRGKLDNNINYYYMRNSTPAGRCYIRLHVGVGSFAEKDEEAGLAHLLEHMAFNDKSYSKNISLAEWFQKQGMAFGPDVNAYTTFDHTVYKIDLPSCASKTLNDALIIIKNFATNLDFKSDVLIKEHNIINKEELEYKNSREIIAEKITNNIFAGTRYPLRPILGHFEARKLLSIDMLRNFYEQWYHPQNLSVLIVGDYGEEDIYKLIDNNFSDIKAKTNHTNQPQAGRLNYEHPFFIVNDDNKAHVELIFSIQNKDILKPSFNKNIYKDRLAFDMAIMMLKNSYAKDAQQKSHIIYPHTINAFLFDKNRYELTLKIMASKENIEANFIDAFRTLRHAAEYGFDEKDFEESKNIYKDNVDQAIINEPTLGSAHWTELILMHINKQRFLYGARYYRDMINDYLPSLSAQDCQRALQKALKSGHEFFFAVGDIKDSAQNISMLKDILKKAKNEKVNKISNYKKIEFSYAIPQCPMLHIAPRKNLSNLDAFTINFSKNLNVIFKPMKSKNDEILLSIFTDEGISSMNKSELSQALLAQTLLLTGGLAKHTQEDLISLRRDKLININFNLHFDRLQAHISTRREDLRFALELLRATLEDPAYAETALSRTKEQLKIDYAELKNNIWRPFKDDFPKAIYNNDYRIGLKSLEDLLAVKRSDLLEWHKKYLASRPLNIVIVGDFDSNEVIADIACILGTRRSDKEYEASKTNKALTFKSGLNLVYNIDAYDEASKIVIRYPFNYKTNINFDHKLALITNIIQESLRLKLREKNQLTYTPRVNFYSNKSNFIQNYIDIVIAAPRDEAAKVLEYTKKIIDSLVSTGITHDQLIKARAPYEAQMMSMSDNNNFWLYLLTDNFKNAPTMPSFKYIIKDINNIKLSDINTILKTMRRNKASSAIVHGSKEQ
jgi:zinc protease